MRSGSSTRSQSAPSRRSRIGTPNLPQIRQGSPLCLSHARIARRHRGLLVYAFFIVHRSSRRVIHIAATRNPTQAWTAQQLRNATIDGDAPAVLLRDRDDKFGPAFDRAAKGVGAKVIRTAVRAPNMNAIAERFVGSVRREMLDHVLLSVASTPVAARRLGRATHVPRLCHSPVRSSATSTSCRRHPRCNRRRAGSNRVRPIANPSAEERASPTAAR